MNKLTRVIVKNGKNKTYTFRKELLKMGFSYYPKPYPYWSIWISEDRLTELEDWCFKRKLSFISEVNNRSNDYRNCFFESNQGRLGKDRYFCSYCGKILNKERVCVDHLISIKKSQSSEYYLNLLRRMHCQNVNDVQNLVSSCRRCNSRKGAKGGLWVLRGRLGRHLSFWIGLRCFEFIFFVGIIILVLKMFNI